jgi:sugar phosphate isomerase/epimerase
VTAILVQEQHLPGGSLEEKWDKARGYGYDGIELRGAGDLRFAARLPDLRRAAAVGVPMPTVCVDMLHFIGDFDAERRRDARVQIRSQLSVIAEIGGRGAMTPASYGMFSRRLPPFEPPRTPQEDRAILVDALGELGRHAETEGVTLYLEPLNRYEDHMVNRLADGVSLLEEVDLASVRLGADTYHMNIEEADPAGPPLAPPTSRSVTPTGSSQGRGTWIGQQFARVSRRSDMTGRSPSKAACPARPRTCCRASPRSCGVTCNAGALGLCVTKP